MEANRKATKAKLEAANSKRKKDKERMKLGELSTCLLKIMYEGN